MIGCGCYDNVNFVIWIVYIIFLVGLVGNLLSVVCYVIV